jgi:hypothetical protein
MFSFQQNQRTRRQNRLCLEVERGEGLAQTMYTHVSKCKNYKIKGEREKKERICKL